jgi:predicted alpha/beta-fold hydrolase
MRGAPWWLPGGHTQTIWASKVAGDDCAQPLCWRRERLETPDQDFVDIDHIDAPGAATMWVMFHGLEGSRHSHYARAMAGWARRSGCHLALPHFRGCSGEINRAPRAYHSGDHAEMDHILRHLVAQHRARGGGAVHVVGISLGGNALMLWAAMQGEAACALVDSVTSVCSPLDLTASGHAIGRGLSRWLYTPYFLRSMLPKARQKWQQYPGLFDLQRLDQVRDLYGFDDLFTAPLHGFGGADDYWRRASAKPRLRDIRVSARIINALNDPFIPASSLPTPDQVSATCQLIYTRRGGHVGYVAGAWPPGHISVPRLIVQ